MGASIQDLDSYRKKKDIQKKKDSPEYHRTEFQRAVDGTLALWESCFYSGTLDKFISEKLGIGKNDIFNLNVIANVEKSLGMEVSLFYPNTLPHNPTGYVAGFNHVKYALATPEMSSEAEARLINILLFLEVSEMEKAGIF